MKIVFAVITFCYCFFSNAQQKEIFNEDIKQSEIILLGEQTHGDGAVFDKKVALIQQIHKELGYVIIAFESGLYDNFKAHQLYTSGKEDINIYNQSIFPIWSNTVAFKNLLDYIKQNPEIKILGFDSQESTLFENYFLEDLKRIMFQNNISVSTESFIEIEKVIIYKDIENFKKNKTDFEKLMLKFEAILEKLNTINKTKLEDRIIVQTFKSALADTKFGYDILVNNRGYVQNSRDKQMAENFMFLKEQYPNEKIIAWGASYHFSNKLSDFSYSDITETYIKQEYQLQKKILNHQETKITNIIEEIKELQYAIPMGKILKEHYKEKLYSLAFTSYQGEYKGAQEKTFPIRTPPNNSIENELFQKNSGETLINLKEYKVSPYYTSALGYIPLFADWATVFDGIYYIPDMYIPKVIEYDETNNLQHKKTTNLIGNILDSKSKTPIKYADVYYSSNNKSVLTNEYGGFIIKRNTNKNEYLVFSAFGYLTDSIQVQNFKHNQKIYLKEKEIVDRLEEVIVIAKSKKLTAKEIIKKARKKIEDNYVQTAYNQDFLYKVQNYNQKDSLTFNEEALINTYNKRGINGSNNSENGFFGEISEFRNTTDNIHKDKWSGVGNLWVTLNRDIILSKSNVLYRTSSYDLKKEGVIDYDAKRIYKISFTNNSPGSYSTGFGYPAPEKSNGVIYIDKKTFAVLRYEHCITREKYDSKHLKKKIQNFHKIVQTYKEVNNLHFINLQEFITKSDYYTLDEKYLGHSYKISSLTSYDINIQNVTPIKRPILNLKQKFKEKEDTSFWDEYSENTISNFQKYFSCNSK